LRFWAVWVRARADTAELKENELYVTIRKYDDTFTGQVSKRSCTH